MKKIVYPFYCHPFSLERFLSFTRCALDCATFMKDSLFWSGESNNIYICTFNDMLTCGRVEKLSQYKFRFEKFGSYNKTILL